MRQGLSVKHKSAAQSVRFAFVFHREKAIACDSSSYVKRSLAVVSAQDRKDYKI